MFAAFGHPEVTGSISPPEDALGRLSLIFRLIKDQEIQICEISWNDSINPNKK